MCVYYRMSVLSLFFSSFFFAPNTHIHIHTHIHTKHTPSLKENKLSGGEAGSSASLIIHTLTHTHTLKGDLHG